jgi:hypothetical protein
MPRALIETDLETTFWFRRVRRQLRPVSQTKPESRANLRNGAAIEESFTIKHGTASLAFVGALGMA